ncbi:MAG: hypothetical protein QOE24_2040 [Frankiales bacterium]|nr:hypothetical protein [Frankiales bacterium]
MPDGNLWGEPSFVDAVQRDYRPAALGLLVDAGRNALPYGWLSLPAKDFAGHKRVVDGNKDGKAVVDIGAYERQ